MISHKGNVPFHVAIIMDGNSRWATQYSKSRLEGHMAGAKVAKDVIKWALDCGVTHLSLYALSKENMKRPKDEVTGIFDIVIETFNDYQDLVKNSIRLHRVGSRYSVRRDVLEKFEDVQKATAHCSKMQLYVMLNYSGQQEIIDAAAELCSRDKKDASVDFNSVNSCMYIPQMPQIDLIIRTGKRHRISNLLLWHSAYAEIRFLDIFWPEFSHQDFLRCVQSFLKTERTFGGRNT